MQGTADDLVLQSVAKCYEYYEWQPIRSSHLWSNASSRFRPDQSTRKEARHWAARGDSQHQKHRYHKRKATIQTQGKDSSSRDRHHDARATKVEICGAQANTMSQASSGAGRGSRGLGRYLRSWQWPLRKTSYPVIRCWFCNERCYVGEDESIAATDHRFPLSRGKPSNWICCRCGSRNLLDSKQPHGIGTWEPAMAQEATQHPSPASTPKRHTLLRSPLAAESSPLLCRRCRTNLQIQATVLSEEGGDDSDGGADFEELKTHLDDRYPVLCENCRPAVTAEISSRNKEAKREIWRQQMDQRAGSSTSSSVRKSGPGSSSRRAAQRLWTAVAWVQVAIGVLACLAVVGTGAGCCSQGSSPALFLLFAATLALQLYRGYDESQTVLQRAPSRAMTASMAMYTLFTGCISAVTTRAGVDGRPVLLLVAVAELAWLANVSSAAKLSDALRRVHGS